MIRRQRRHWPLILTASVILLTGMTLAWSARALGAPPPLQEPVAFAQVAVVRLLVQYADMATGTEAPILCTGLGTIIATTGSDGQNAHTSIITDAQLVNPSVPCRGAQDAYVQKMGVAPKAWRQTSITALLNTAYTGGPAISFALDTSAITTVGADGAVIALPLASEPGHDLPVIPLAAIQNPPRYVIDLGKDNIAYTMDAIDGNTASSKLTPVVFTADMLSQIPVLPTPTPTPAPTAIPTGTTTITPTAKPASPTAIPTKAARTPTTAAPTATMVAAPLLFSPGAPVIDDENNGLGNLVGIVVQTAAGERVASLPNIVAALNAAPVTTASRPGTFSKTWHQGLDTFYAATDGDRNDVHFTRAITVFKTLSQNYPDFKGIVPWLNAAQAATTNLNDVAATPTPKAAPTPAPTNILPGIPIKSKQGLLILGIALVVLLLGLFFWGRALTVGRRKRGITTNPMLDEVERPDTARLPAILLSSSGVGPRERRADPEALPSTWRLTSFRPTVPLPSNRKMARLGIQAAGLTDPGLRRKADPNQDSILALHGARLHQGEPQAFGLFVVADGMGGHQNGREASIHAIEKLVDAVLQPLLDGSMLSEDDLLDLLKTGVEKANLSLHQRNLRQHADMGTTITAVLITGDVAHLANVGDSRTYHMQSGFPLRQITVDHSVVAGLVAAGVIRPDDVYTHPKRNQIYRSLGEKDEVDVDTFRLILQPGDMLLLCSDGLWEMVRDPRMETLLRAPSDLQPLAESLIAEANANGGVDNISAVIVKILDEQFTPKQTGMHIYAGPPSLMGR